MGKEFGLGIPIWKLSVCLKSCKWSDYLGSEPKMRREEVRGQGFCPGICKWGDKEDSEKD